MLAITPQRFSRRKLAKPPLVFVTGRNNTQRPKDFPWGSTFDCSTARLGTAAGQKSLFASNFWSKGSHRILRRIPLTVPHDRVMDRHARKVHEHIHD
jgi:hypothetical protein